jgi:DNA polymerase III alpha subunit
MSEFKTDLGDYVLWYDGIVEINPSRLEDLFLKGIEPNRIAVSDVNSEVDKFNRLSKDKITTKEEIDVDLLTYDWKIPIEYQNIDVADYVWHEFANKLPKVATPMEHIRRARIDRELKEYTDRNLLDVLKVLIYIVDMFKKNNVVWGVGRGSSCASYILFLLEVHSVDPIKYDIPLEEFFK